MNLSAEKRHVAYTVNVSDKYVAVEKKLNLWEKLKMLRIGNMQTNTINNSSIGKLFDTKDIMKVESSVPISWLTY